MNNLFRVSFHFPNCYCINGGAKSSTLLALTSGESQGQYVSFLLMGHTDILHTNRRQHTWETWCTDVHSWRFLDNKQGGELGNCHFWDKLANNLRRQVTSVVSFLQTQACVPHRTWVWWRFLKHWEISFYTYAHECCTNSSEQFFRLTRYRIFAEQLNSFHKSSSMLTECRSQSYSPCSWYLEKHVHTA